MQDLFGESRILRKRFELLILEYRQDLWRYCLALTRTPFDAEDLSQDTLLKAFGQLNYFYQVLNPKAYLLRIASNLWIDKHRKMFQEELHDMHPGSNETASTTDGNLPFQVWESIEEMVEVLTPAQRVAVLLADVFGFQNKEIAEMLSVSESGVKSIRHRARLNLRSKDKGDRENTPIKRVAQGDRHAIVDAYVDAFNRHDAKAVAALLDEGATTDIYGVSHEYGKDTIVKASLAGWANDPLPMRAEYVEIAGQPTILVFGTPDSKPEGLTTLIHIQIHGDKITSLKNYYFCPELIQNVAKRLGVPAYPNGTFWT